MSSLKALKQCWYWERKSCNSIIYHCKKRMVVLNWLWSPQLCPSASPLR